MQMAFIVFIFGLLLDQVAGRVTSAYSFAYSVKTAASCNHKAESRANLSRLRKE